MSHKNKELVEKLSFALQVSDSIRKKDEEIISNLDKKILNLGKQLEIREKQIANLNKSISIEQHKVTLERSKRWGLSAIAGAGYGVGFSEPQTFIGIGISYNFLKF